MELTDLIFKPFEVICPQCRKRVTVMFEELQFNDELTCPKCENVFSPNIDTKALLELIKMVEDRSSQESSAAKKKE